MNHLRSLLRRNAPVAGSLLTLSMAAVLCGCDGGGGASSVFPQADSGRVTTGLPAASVDPLASALAASSTIFSSTSAPTSATVSDRQAVELGVKFTSSQAGRISAIRFYKGPQNTGNHVAHLWDVSGRLLASAAFTGESASGWQQASLSSSVSIAANTTYTASYHTSVGSYADNTNYFTSALTRGNLTVPANGGVYAYAGASVFPASAYQASNYWVDIVFSPAGNGATPTPTIAPSPIPSPGGLADLASVLCVGGSKYSLDDHDWFDKDSALSVSDSWPESGGAEWSNRFQWGRSNNVGTDQSYYASQAGLQANGQPPVASLIPGVGVALKAYPEPPAVAEAPGNQDFYFGGLLSNSKAYATGYWVYSAKLPSGTGWFPALWLLSENGGAYNEIDNMEAWGPTVLGPNVLTQTEQGSPYLQQRSILPTGQTAQHSYGALVASNYVAFYIDAVATTKRFTRYRTTALNPVMNMGVCTNTSWCAPAPPAGATAQMVVRYYAHYSAPAAPAACSPNDISTPAP